MEACGLRQWKAPAGTWGRQEQGGEGISVHSGFEKDFEGSEEESRGDSEGQEVDRSACVLPRRWDPNPKLSRGMETGGRDVEGQENSARFPSHGSKESGACRRAKVRSNGDGRAQDTVDLRPLRDCRQRDVDR